MKSSFLKNLLLVLFFLKASGLGIGKDLTWWDLLAYFIGFCIAEVIENQYSVQVRIWILDRILAFKKWQYVRKVSRDIKDQKNG